MSVSMDLSRRRVRGREAETGGCCLQFVIYLNPTRREGQGDRLSRSCCAGNAQRGTNELFNADINANRSWRSRGMTINTRILRGADMQGKVAWSDNAAQGLSRDPIVHPLVVGTFIVSYCNINFSVSALPPTTAILRGYSSECTVSTVSTVSIELHAMLLDSIVPEDVTVA
jgi:hypothetical protein